MSDDPNPLNKYSDEDFEAAARIIERDRKAVIKQIAEKGLPSFETLDAIEFSAVLDGMHISSRGLLYLTTSLKALLNWSLSLSEAGIMLPFKQDDEMDGDFNENQDRTPEGGG